MEDMFKSHLNEISIKYDTIGTRAELENLVRRAKTSNI